MTLIVVLATITTITALYQTAFEQQRMRLTELALSQARVIEAVGRFDAVHSQDAHPQGASAATLQQFVDAHGRYRGFGKTGEFTLAKLETNQITFLLRHRHGATNIPTPVPMDSALAEPMRRALTGNSGTIIGLDYRGEMVLAAHEPVGVLNWGIVAKIDLAEIRAPFIRAGFITLAIAALLIGIGTMLFTSVSGQIIHQLEKSEAHHRGIFESAGDGILTVNHHGSILAINPAAEKIFGYNEHELIGQHASILISDDTHPETFRSLNSIFDSGQPTNLSSMEMIGLKKDGTNITIDTTISNASTQKETVHTWILRDIQERKQLEQELELHRQNLAKLVDQRTEKLSETLNKLENTQTQLIQTEKLASIGQLAAGVAHEINNPVGYVSSNIFTLKGYVDDVFELLEMYEKHLNVSDETEFTKKIESRQDELDVDFLKTDIVELINESLEGVKRVKQIVQDLKDFSRTGSADWEESDLHAGIESTLNIVHNELKYKAEVVKELGNLPLVECIPAQINQIMMNLLVNAGHAIEESGTITVRSGREKEEVWLEVEDTGKGISEENLQKIFDPFFTTKAVGQGTGLGLALSYGILQKHNGRFEVDSKVGRGTRFRLWIPIRHQENSDEIEGQATKA